MNRRFILSIALCLFWGASTLQTHADEPADRILAAMRENGYYELALEYLNDLQSSDLLDDEFRVTLPFEKAETLIQSVAQLRDIKAWDARLDEAEQLLKTYAANVTSDKIKAKTEIYSGDIFSRRARAFMKQAESDRLTQAEQQQLLDNARSMLESGLASFTSSRNIQRSLLENFQLDTEDPNSADERKQLRFTYAQTRLKWAKTKELVGDTYSANPAQGKAIYTEAAEEFADLHDDYQSLTIGWDAAYFCARARAKTGKYDDALMMLDSIFQMDNVGTLRILKRSALRLGAECWERKDPFPHDEIIRNCERTIEGLARQELRHPDWLQVQLTLAKAYRAKAEETGKEKRPGAASEVKLLNRTAAKMARNVSRIPGEQREMAKSLLSQWNVKVSENATEPEANGPASFETERQKGQDQVAEIESILNDIRSLNLELRGKPANETEIREQIAEAEGELITAAESAHAAFESALSMRAEDTPQEDINKIRYLQSYCYFATKQFLESSVIAEFLLDQYPSVNWTQQAAGLLVKSLAVMQFEAETDDKPNSTRALANACTRVIDLWPGSSEAADAAGKMTNIALANGDFESAQQYVEKISADHPNRARYAAKLGQRLWFDYAKKKKTLPEDEAKNTVGQAVRYLKDGVQSANLNAVTYDDALSSRLLVNAYLESGDVAAAVKQLEEHELAPLELIKRQHPAIVNSPNRAIYKRGTFIVAIKTYLAAMRAFENQSNWINKAKGVLDGMRQDAEASNDPADRERLAAIYRLIADELIDQFDSIEEPAKKMVFVDGIKDFLTSIEKESQNGKRVLWAASTLIGVADKLQKTNPQQAKPLYQQAVSAFNRAEQLGFGTDESAKKNKIQLRYQRALAERGQGNYEEAVKQMAEILKVSNGSVQIQLDAARTLQAWGKSTRRGKPLIEAMMGRDKFTNPQTKKKINAVWGWRRLFDRTRNQPAFVDAFYESLYGLIEARYEYGLIEKTAQGKKATDAAKRELARALQRDPDMGGPKWKAKFEKLDKRIKSGR